MSAWPPAWRACCGTPGRRGFCAGGAWIIGEWLRSWVLSGFPWNLLGYSWAFSDQMMQIVAWTGSWGLSLITMVGCGLPALLLRWAPIAEEAPPLAGKAGWCADRRPGRARPRLVDRCGAPVGRER